MFLTVSLAVTVVALLLGYCHYCHQYWQSKGVYVPPMLPIFGHTIYVLKEVRFEYLHKIFTKSKTPFFGMYQFVKPKLIVKDMEILKKILVKDFDHFSTRREMEFSESDHIYSEMLFMVNGERWKQIRTTVSPTFTSGRLKGILPLIENKCQALVDWCLNHGLQGDMELKGTFSRITLDTIATCAFGIESNCLENEESEFSKAAIKATSQSGITVLLKFLLVLSCPRLYQFFNLRIGPPSLDILGEVVRSSLKNCKTSGRRGDFLDLMLDAKEDNKKQNKYPVTVNTIISQSVLFLIAGHETTASALAFTVFLLAKHQDAQRKLREEIKGLVEIHGGLTYQALGEAKYLDACLHESLRLYPPAGYMDRTCTKDYVLPQYNLKIEKGTIIGLPIWTINRNPEIFEDPESFRPERFLPENKTAEKAFSFMSFGQGPRNCIGMRFALLESKLLLAHLILKLEMVPVPGHENVPPLRPSPNLIATKDGLYVKFQPVEG
ncbi:cytochrome P450 6k1-like isoform X1 [Oratosquilla oratoria]|uniref:cytochrome P450 6k1-like isoform X1 n=1 Tax=Oratosquilla oratoria TaxID=337810 RepID=UPI003F7720EF